MEIIFAHEPSKSILNEIYSIVSDYTKDFFTLEFPDIITIDMQFQRTTYLTISGEIVSVIVFTALDGVPQITLMATKRKYQGKGYGKILMNNLVEHLTSMGLHKIELYTHLPEKKPIVLSTVAFYESMGFIKDKVYPDLWGTGALKMIKKW